MEKVIEKVNTETKTQINNRDEPFTPDDEKSDTPDVRFKTSIENIEESMEIFYKNIKNKENELNNRLNILDNNILKIKNVMNKKENII